MDRKGKWNHESETKNKQQGCRATRMSCQGMKQVTPDNVEEKAMTRCNKKAM